MLQLQMLENLHQVDSFTMLLHVRKILKKSQWRQNKECCCVTLLDILLLLEREKP